MKILRASSLVVGGVLAVGACRSPDPAPPKRDVGAESPERAPPPKVASAPPAQPFVDLLHTVACTVAVSFKVANPHAGCHPRSPRRAHGRLRQG